jgi:hypothetical protein
MLVMGTMSETLIVPGLRALIGGGKAEHADKAVERMLPQLLGTSTDSRPQRRTAALS